MNDTEFLIEEIAQSLNSGYVNFDLNQNIRELMKIIIGLDYEYGYDALAILKYFPELDEGNEFPDHLKGGRNNDE